MGEAARTVVKTGKSLTGMRLRAIRVMFSLTGFPVLPD
jgi:hypothetical protein